MRPNFHNRQVDIKSFLLQLYYCAYSSVQPAVIAFSIFWLLNLFVGLAIAADDFFCPSLAFMSKKMR
jgi:hypothetical protein